MLTIDDKKYISTTIATALNTAIKPALNVVLKESKKNLGIVLDQVKYEGKLSRELMSSYAPREEIQDIVDDGVKRHVVTYHTNI